MRENGMGDVGIIKGGLLASKLCCKRRRIVIDIVDHSGLGVYRREEEEETINIKQTKHHKA